MDRVQKAIEALIKRHGGLRAAARATKLDHGYLCRLRNGKKTNPSPSVLAVLGLEREVSYRQKKRTREPVITEATTMN